MAGKRPACPMPAMAKAKATGPSAKAKALATPTAASAPSAASAPAKAAPPAPVFRTFGGKAVTRSLSAASFPAGPPPKLSAPAPNVNWGAASGTVVPRTYLPRKALTLMNCFLAIWIQKLY